MVIQGTAGDMVRQSTGEDMVRQGTAEDRRDKGQREKWRDRGQGNVLTQLTGGGWDMGKGDRKKVTDSDNDRDNRGKNTFDKTCTIKNAGISLCQRTNCQCDNSPIFVPHNSV